MVVEQFKLMYLRERETAHFAKTSLYEAPDGRCNCHVAVTRWRLKFDVACIHSHKLNKQGLGERLSGLSPSSSQTRCSPYNAIFFYHFPLVLFRFYPTTAFHCFVSLTQIMPVMGGGDAPNGGASEGSERVKPSSQDSRDLNFLMASCYPISLKVHTDKL